MIWMTYEDRAIKIWYDYNMLVWNWHEVDRSGNLIGYEKAVPDYFLYDRGWTVFDAIRSEVEGDEAFPD